MSDSKVTIGPERVTVVTGKIRSVFAADVESAAKQVALLQSMIEGLQAAVKCAHAAIVDAIGSEEGLDGSDGDAVLRQIEDVMPSLKQHRVSEPTGLTPDS